MTNQFFNSVNPLALFSIAQGNTNRTSSNVITIIPAVLASLLLLALIVIIAGLILAVLSRKRKLPHHYNDAVMYTNDNCGDNPTYMAPDMITGSSTCSGDLSELHFNPHAVDNEEDPSTATSREDLLYSSLYSTIRKY